MFISGGGVSVDGLNPTPVALLVCWTTDWRPVFDFLVLLFNIRMVYSSCFTTS